MLFEDCKILGTQLSVVHSTGHWKIKDYIILPWPAFKHSYTNQDIVGMPKVPHILKLVWNWLLDNGFKLNGSTIDYMPFQALIHAAQQTEIMVCPKLHKEHLVWKISQNIQEVKCENCCAVTIPYRIHSSQDSLRFMKMTPNQKTDFTELVNNFFNILNMRFPIYNSTQITLWLIYNRTKSTIGADSKYFHKY